MIFNKEKSMTDAELKAQPRSVREEFERIKEGEIDHDEQLSSLKTQLADLLAKQHESQAVHDRIRVCLQWLPTGIASTENRLQEIKAQRVSAITMALVDDKEGSGLPDFSLDDALVAEQKNAELYLERLRLSAAGLEQQEKKARRAVELASNPCSAIESKINRHRDQLKLTEAKRRHGYA
ncbi:hypothetical protein AT959_08615 [Dechloromonas denitrificans]|uniref:Uncharacterized protein n=2 Tax=Dechloromonas denitrificans TaxID=281362 RepID=A0A133XIM3_9RHOO|nr:hypothetical protein AT959_08615 [Dechloromonas denitrificans]